MRWLAFGTYDAQRHPRIAVLIEGLRLAGDQVVELNEPLPLDTAARVAMLGQPWRVPLLGLRLLRCWARLIAGARRSRRDRDVDAVLVGYLGHFDVRLARRLFPDVPIVLDHLASAAGIAKDRNLARAGGPKAALMRWLDDRALRSADVVVVDTEEQARGVPAGHRDRAVVAPVGAGSAWFAAAGSGASGQARPVADMRLVAEVRLRAIFFGLFTPLHGTEVLGAALAELADDDRIAVTMVGTGQDYAECRRLAAGNPRVSWLDWVPADELPALVAQHDVCLGIFGTTEKAHAVVPTKVYQGAAAGCLVLTSDTGPQRAALGGSAWYVPAGDSPALAGALRRLAGQPDRLPALKSDAARWASERFAPLTVVASMRRAVASIQAEVDSAA
ncbi:MAG TPA: glycosyltransferase [Micromonosporaceae bacterium]